jgi:hydroxymandelonitrile lyase/serine carboxypeptidase-like clade 2
MLPPYDPCAVFNSIKYLNLPEVQKALHANISGIIEYPWAVCRSLISSFIFQQCSLHNIYTGAVGTEFIFVGYYLSGLCSNTIFDNWGQAADDLLPVYRELIQAGLRVWVFR